MFTSQPKRKARSSTSSSSNREYRALSTNPRSSKRSAIGSDDIDDVATLACVEVSRAVMTRPEVNTGSLFKLIAASRHNTNKSDAVLVIAAAILQSIGNDKAATDILNRSKTVSAFYKQMRLDDLMLRTSFTIMLFALAPEFVKMIETSVKISIERVQAVTEAPYAETKVFKAASMLVDSGSVSPTEYNTIINNMTKLEISSSTARNSVQLTPTEMISADDSISQVGSRDKGRFESKVTTSGLMEFIREKRKTPDADFYSKFANAKRPIAVAMRPARVGLGYKAPETEVSSAQTGTDLTNALDSLLGDKISQVKPRHKILAGETSSFRRPNMSSTQVSSETEIPFTGRRKDFVAINPLDYLVTSEDIKDKGSFIENEAEGMSFVTPDSKMTDQELLDLL
jgi:hypothetical protein